MNQTTHSPERIAAAQAALTHLVSYWEALATLEQELGFDLDDQLDVFASGLGAPPVTEPEAVSLLDFLLEGA